jgi:hypothetical protein
MLKLAQIAAAMFQPATDRVVLPVIFVATNVVRSSSVFI